MEDRIKLREASSQERKQTSEGEQNYDEQIYEQEAR